MLRAVLPSASRGDLGIKALAMIYAEDLVEFPIDILREACAALRRRERWFPKIVDIREECQWRGRDRIMRKKAILDALGQHR